MAFYEKRMQDSFGDPFTVRAVGGQIWVVGDEDIDYNVADLAFTPDAALKLARRLTRAAQAAYEQERDAAAGL